MPVDDAQGQQPENQPAQGTGSEAAKPADAQGQQPASATARPAQQPDTRQYFDPKQHVPRSRLDEVSGKAQRREAELSGLLDQERKRVLALSGVTPQSKEEQEFEQARAVLERIYPGLKKLSDADFVKKLEASTGAVEQLQANTDQHWTNQGVRAFRELEDFAKKELNGELTPRGQRALRAAFIDYIQSDEQAAAAYVENDPDVIKGFWEEYRKSFIDPVRRASGAAQINRGDRLRLPRGGGSAPNAPAPKKVDFKDEDAVMNAAWETVQARMANGG